MDIIKTLKINHLCNQSIRSITVQNNTMRILSLIKPMIVVSYLGVRNYITAQMAPMAYQDSSVLSQASWKIREITSKQVLLQCFHTWINNFNIQYCIRNQLTRTIPRTIPPRISIALSTSHLSFKEVVWSRAPSTTSMISIISLKRSHIIHHCKIHRIRL